VTYGGGSAWSVDSSKGSFHALRAYHLAPYLHPVPDGVSIEALN